MRGVGLLVLGGAGFLVMACGGDKPNETAASPQLDSAVAGITGDSVTDTTNAVGDTSTAATALVRDATGKELGTVNFTSTAGGVQLQGDISGLPAGEHGIHVHAVGKCEPPFETAGPHWNPANRQHGTLNPNGPHGGDLPNLTVSGDGLGSVRATVTGHTLRDLLDADGASLVVHEKADDYRTDPSGNSGSRIACGVITLKT